MDVNLLGYFVTDGRTMSKRILNTCEWEYVDVIRLYSNDARRWDPVKINILFRVPYKAGNVTTLQAPLSFFEIVRL
jgi:hypothetical protein